MSKKSKVTSSTALVEDRINVNLFDQLNGIDEETMKIVNAKISDIKEISEQRIQDSKQNIEALQTKISKYEQMDFKLHGLLKMGLDQVIRSLP